METFFPYLDFIQRYLLAFFSGKMQLCPSLAEAGLHLVLPCPFPISACFVILGPQPFWTGKRRRHAISRELLHPVGARSRHHAGFLSRKAYKTPNSEGVWVKDAYPLPSVGRWHPITSHLPAAPTLSSVIQLGNQVWTHRRAVPSTVCYL